MSESGEWWWCLEHHRAEADPDVRADRRLGPYASEDEAEHALQHVEERNETWDNDPRWNDDVAGPDA